MSMSHWGLTRLKRRAAVGFNKAAYFVTHFRSAKPLILAAYTENPESPTPDVIDQNKVDAALTGADNLPDRVVLNRLTQTVFRTAIDNIATAKFTNRIIRDVAIAAAYASFPAVLRHFFGNPPPADDVYITPLRWYGAVQLLSMARFDCAVLSRHLRQMAKAHRPSRQITPGPSGEPSVA